jgi:beta-glucosidase
MASIAHLIFSGLLAATVANSQQYEGSSRNEDAFNYVQPRNTTILGQYGHSPAVLPSRTFLIRLKSYMTVTDP